MKVEDFLYSKGISTDTTIGTEGDYLLTELLLEYRNHPLKTHVDFVNHLIVNAFVLDNYHFDLLFEKLAERKKLPSKDDILTEAKSVYDEINNGTDLEAIR